MFFGVSMMIIDLRRLKLHPGSREEFILETRGKPELLNDLDGRFLEPVQAELVVSNSGCCFNGQGRLKTRVELNCSRCLEKVVYPIAIQFQFTISLEATDDDRQSEDILPYGSGEVDLEPLINELIITELPLIPLCRPDCLGLCPHCGCNKNTGRCSCADNDIDPRWEKLSKLR